jgi:hypothetical protein
MSEAARRIGAGAAALLRRRSFDMTDPRTPEPKREDEQLPDDLDQTAGAGLSAGLFGQHGSEDAQLLAGAAQAEDDVEGEGPGRSSD